MCSEIFISSKDYFSSMDRSRYKAAIKQNCSLHETNAWSRNFQAIEVIKENSLSKTEDLWIERTLNTMPKTLPFAQALMKPILSDSASI